MPCAIQDVNDIVILMSAPGITFVQGQFFLNHSTCPKNPYKEKKLSQKTRKEKQGMDEKIRVQVVVLRSENYTHQHWTILSAYICRIMSTLNIELYGVLA